MAALQLALAEEMRPNDARRLFRLLAGSAGQELGLGVC